MSNRGSGGRMVDADPFTELGLNDQQSDKLWGLAHRHRPSPQFLSNDDWFRLVRGIFRIAQLQNAKSRTDAISVSTSAVAEAVAPLLKRLDDKLALLDARLAALEGVQAGKDGGGQS